MPKHVIPARHKYKILVHKYPEELTALIENFANEQMPRIGGIRGLRHEILDIQYAGKGEIGSVYSVLIRYNDLYEQGSVYSHENGYEK